MLKLKSLFSKLHYQKKKMPAVENLRNMNSERDSTHHGYTYISFQINSD